MGGGGMSKIKRGWIRHQEVSETLQRLNVTLQQQCLSFPLIGHFEQTFPLKKKTGFFQQKHRLKQIVAAEQPQEKKQEIN